MQISDSKNTSSCEITIVRTSSNTIRKQGWSENKLHCRIKVYCTNQRCMQNSANAFAVFTLLETLLINLFAVLESLSRVHVLAALDIKPCLMRIASSILLAFLVGERCTMTPSLEVLVFFMHHLHEFFLSFTCNP